MKNLPVVRFAYTNDFRKTTKMNNVTLRVHDEV